MAINTANGLDEIKALAGKDLGKSAWLEITQEQVDLFARATGDHQWIHVDPERAKDGPFGTTIAHGFLTLSLIPRFFDSAFEIRNVGMGVNYGLNRVRFTSPVPAGSRLRGRFKLLECTPVANGGYQMNWQVTVEREGSDKPACIAEAISRRYP